jgi:hypothetical protein
MNINLNSPNAERTDRASTAFDLVPEARQTYPTEDDLL